MVAVRVTDEDVLHLTVVEFVFDELSLRAFARVEEKAVFVPSQEISVVIARACGDLCSGAENEEFGGAMGQS